MERWRGEKWRYRLKEKEKKEREGGREWNERKRDALSFVSRLTIFHHEGKGPIRSIKCSCVVFTMKYLAYHLAVCVCRSTGQSQVMAK